MAEHLNSAPRKRQRRRPTKSCEPCRARKIRCDRGLPCKPCMRSRAFLTCTYTSDHTPISYQLQGHTTPQLGPTHGASPSPITLELSQSGGDAPGPAEPPCVPEPGDSTTQSLSERVGILERLFQHAEHDPQRTGSMKDLETRLSRIEKRIEGCRPDLRPSDESELRIELPRPHLRAEHEKTRLFGKTHWVHSLDQFSVLAQMQSRPYSVVDGTQIAEYGSMHEAASARRRAKTHGTKLLQEPMPALRESIPAKSICDQAIDGYLRTFEPMFRILHVPSFMAEYERYCTGTGSARYGFLMKLTMVLTIGAIFLRDRSVANRIKRTAHDWVYAVQWWLTGPTERDAMSIDGIQTFCLLLLARQTSALGGAASIMTEALSKLSFTLGLHVNPRFHASVTPFESELRRRLWLTVLELATITSLNSTLPLLLHVGDYDVPLPSNTADSKLRANADDNAGETPQEHTKHDGLNCSLQLMLAKSLRLRMQVVRELNDGGREVAYGRVVALANSLQTHCREMAVFFQRPDNDETKTRGQGQGQGPDVPGFHHKFLDTYFRRLILFLHRPFAHRARRDHRYLLSRKTCLESSLIMASYTESADLAASGSLAEEEDGGGGNDDFSSCCISGGGMFKGALGPDIILGVSLEIVTQLEEEQEQEEGGGERGPDEPQSSPRRRGHRCRRSNRVASPAPRTDPLALLARSQREPLLRYLRRVREQWRHVIRLGRPSLKQYLFVSCILAHVEAMQAGSDARAAVIDTIRLELRECTVLLRESPAYAYAYVGDDDDDAAAAAASGWVNDHDAFPETIDTMALFGFDFGALDSAFATDMPVWTDTPSTTDLPNLI